MRGILIDPGAKPVICKLPDTEAGLHRYLGGQPRRVSFGSYPAALLYCSRAGERLPCRHYIDRWYYGRLLIVGWRNGNITNMDKAAAEALAAKWENPEVAP